MPRHLFAACLLGILPLACTAQNTAGPESPAPTGDAAHTSKITYSSCHVDGPYIALTFDDGPHAANTPRLLDMLKQRGIKATFFMVGECAQEYPQIVKRIVAEGHEVANHSWKHLQLTKMGEATLKQDLQKAHDAIVAGGGVAPKLLRPPYGAFRPEQQKWAHNEFGYKCILWDVDPLDWKVRNAAHVESEILKHTVSGSIILSHDIHKTTIDAMPSTIDTLLSRGFKFVTVSQLLAMDKPVAPKPKTAPASPVTKEAPTERAAPTATAPAVKAAPVAESGAGR
jgi:peptidoglycan/xylan/chitin deacetylase (PgdA/CDA1 family)